MNEEAKKKVAQFRFGIIHDLIGDRKLTRGERQRLLKEKSACQWEIPLSERTYISMSTILSWVRAYERGGRRLEGLYPSDRKDRGRPRALDEDTAASLIQLKKQYRSASLPVILREARLRKILPSAFKACNATVYRLLKQHGLMDKDVSATDRRRFEAELPNDIWQSDCLHGPMVTVQGKQMKTYLFAFIDDMSRLICHAEFYRHERLDPYIDALMKALSKRGLPRKLYVDNGPIFRSHLLRHATASLGIALIHSKPYQPEGRGKIERFFKTLRMQFLSTCPEELTLEKLNTSLKQWIDRHYHGTIHSSIGQSPLKRYLKHAHLMREAPKDMYDYFRKRTVRKVDKDRTVSLMGRLYEAPLHLIGKMVTLLYHDHDPARVEVFYNGTSQGMLLPLDVKINCRIRRHQHITEILPAATPAEGTPQKQQKTYHGGKLFGKLESTCLSGRQTRTEEDNTNEL